MLSEIGRATQEIVTYFVCINVNKISICVQAFSPYVWASTNTPIVFSAFVFQDAISAEEPPAPPPTERPRMHGVVRPRTSGDRRHVPAVRHGRTCVLAIVFVLENNPYQIELGLVVHPGKTRWEHVSALEKRVGSICPTGQLSGSLLGFVVCVFIFSFNDKQVDI